MCLAFGFLFLNAFNPSLEPTSQFRFQFFLSSKPVERIDCLSPFVEGNVAAGKFLPLHVLRHELRKDALTAWPRREGRIEIQTRWRILKRKFWPPGRSRRAAVAALLQELQLFLEDGKKIPRVVRHGKLPCITHLGPNTAIVQ